MSSSSSSSSDNENHMEDTSNEEERIDDNEKDDMSSSDGDSGSSSSSSSGGESGSTIDEEVNKDLDDDGEEEAEEEEELIAPQGLSKSWAVRSAHVPIYTGGTMALMKLDDSSDDDDDEPTPILLCTMVNGDVGISTMTGVKLCSLRGKGDTVTGGDDDGEEDDEGYDVDTITCFVVLSASARILTCSFNSVIRQYTVLRNGNGSTSKYQVRLDGVLGKSGHALPVTTMVAHGAFIATGSVDGSVRIFDTRHTQLAPTHVFRYSGSAKVTTVVWYPGRLNELIVGIGREDGSISIHNLVSPSAQHKHSKKARRDEAPDALLKDHDSAVTSLVWDLKRKLFYTAGRDSVITLWKMIKEGDKFKYHKLQTVPVYELVEGMQLITAQDVKRTFLVSCGSKGILRLWEAMVSGDAYRLYELAKQSEKDSFGAERGGYLAMRQHDYDGTIVLVADAEHNISLIKIVEEQLDNSQNEKRLGFKTEETIIGQNDEILDVRVVPKSNDIAVVTNSHLIRLFDGDTFRCRILEPCHTATVLCVDASPCGRYLATCGKDKTMRVWHTGTGRCVALAVGHAEAVGSTALSRQSGRYQVTGKAADNSAGSFCISVSVDRTMKRWNLPGDAALNDAAATGKVVTLKAVASIRAHEKDINIVTIAPNDSLIATGSHDKTIAIWKAVDLSQVAILKGHRRGVWDCQFSPYDRVLASSSGDKTIKLWSLSDYSCVRTFQGHLASVLRIRYLCGGLQLVSCGADGLLKLWTVRTNECEATMDSHTGKIWGMDVCGNGKLLFTGAADSRLVCWKDTTAVLLAEKNAEREEEILLNQQLMNHIRRKEYKEALRVSIERDKPHTCLKVLNEILNAESASREPLSSLKLFLKEQTLPNIVRLLRYCREWNVRARNSHVALTLVKMIVSTISIERLAEEDEVPEIIAGMIPYIERHFERLERLHTSSYLIDFLATNMGIMDEDEAAHESAFAKWESAKFKPLAKHVADGRVDIGGSVAVRVSKSGPEDSGDVITLGDSDSESSL